MGSDQRVSNFGTHSCVIETGPTLLHKMSLSVWGCDPNNWAHALCTFRARPSALNHHETTLLVWLFWIAQLDCRSTQLHALILSWRGNTTWDYVSSSVDIIAYRSHYLCWGYKGLFSYKITHSAYICLYTYAHYLCSLVTTAGKKCHL